MLSFKYAQFQREKLDTAEDQNAMFARLAGNRVERTNEDFDLDDMFESRANRQEDEVAAEAKERERAIAEHQRREKVLDTCRYCLGSEVPSHMNFTASQIITSQTNFLGNSKAPYYCDWSKVLFIITSSRIPSGRTLFDHSQITCYVCNPAR